MAWLVAVTFLSVSSNVPMPKVVLFSPDKLAHAGAYGVLVWLLSWGISKSKGRTTTIGELLVIFFSATAYGALMEWVQGTFFPNRFFEYDDMLANAAGAFLAAMLYRPLSKIARPKSKV
ncbi:MAG: VanZ family protein [Saprospiraceae bacterium]|nr:VanZ family protein [Saprospiraceae bacterium]